MKRTIQGCLIDIMKFLNFYAHLLVDRSERDAIEKKFKEDRSVKKVLDLESIFVSTRKPHLPTMQIHDIVDGSENSANQLRWRIYHLFTGVFIHSGSQVVQDFFHQQYDSVYLHALVLNRSLICVPKYLSQQ